MTGEDAIDVVPASDLDADLERRFGGLRRLHGDVHYERLRAARVAVVGLGGVGSWVAEALARSGVAALTLIDLDPEWRVYGAGITITGPTLRAFTRPAKGARIWVRSRLRCA